MLTTFPSINSPPQVDEQGNIVDSCFKTFGCGSAIASSSVATEWCVLVGGRVGARRSASAGGRSSRGHPAPLAGCQLGAVPRADRWLCCVPPTHTHACRVKGKAVDEVLTIKNSDIAKHLSLPPVKLHCSMLAEDAIKAAVQDWKNKQAAAKDGAAQAQAATA